MQVVVAGAGISGLTAALALARQGHPGRLVDRDGTARPAELGSAEARQRRGVAQFHQPHAFLARLHAELAAALPDVLEALYAHGAVPDAGRRAADAVVPAQHAGVGAADHGRGGARSGAGARRRTGGRPPR